MINKIKLVLGSFLVVASLATAQVATVGVPVAQAAPKDELCKGIGGCNRTDQGPTLTATIKNVTNILLFIIGAVSVIMIIIGGLRYVLSGGDSSSVNSAKNTILYAVVGLVVAFAAYAIVNFVITSF